MKLTGRYCCLFAILTLLMIAMGCGRFLTNRYYDARDTIAFGAGVTTENPVTGFVPPSFGAYLELTDWMQLGWINYNGYTAEMDLRGTFVGPESYQRAGFLWNQELFKNQDYDNAIYKNVFKNEDFPWCWRQESIGLSLGGHPAKRLYYTHWARHVFEGTGLLHRGWRYWEYAGMELALSEPFLTHVGVMLRFGFDLSEVSDFVLGWFGGFDFKHDDLTADEYALMRRGQIDAWNVTTKPSTEEEEAAQDDREAQSEPE